jgi:DNA (cytosine-5)-methyltransferase 1
MTTTHEGSGNSADSAGRPKLLDLFCGAGGAEVGYHRAGFDVVGVDIAPQPNYPFEFHQGDALEFLAEHGHEFDARHASPPCQSFTAYRRKGYGVGDGYPDLIEPVRAALVGLDAPYVIENVGGSPLRNAVRYCGSSFGLDVRRHRYFESGSALMALECDHGWQTPRFPPATNRSNMRRTVEVGVWRIPLAVQQRAMGIDWMTLPELSESIPPAYTEHIGAQLLACVQEVAA